MTRLRTGIIHGIFVVIFCLINSHAFCGTTLTAKQDSAHNIKDSNPLSFYDGKLIFDFQERLRWESRNNNFDFNSDVKSPTDGNWPLHRARIGVLIKPVEWLKLYARAEDSIEVGSALPMITCGRN
jgi:hypothetical protein